MALDETLLELKSKHGIPHTLRFLQFSYPTVFVLLMKRTMKNTEFLESGEGRGKF